jgi:hypothetical protein
MYELCGRTKPGGGKCESPALRRNSFCRQISMMKTKNLARIEPSR